MLDFGVLPPEINSSRMYLGPGAAPMMAAAAAWSALATELTSAATGYDTVATELTAHNWFGPSALAMQHAAIHQAAWLRTAAAVAERTSEQAWAAVAAFEAVFAMTVPPAVIAANRTLSAALIATNFLGQNTPAIAATDAHYAEMWAQDATAMCGYAASSAAARELAPFPAPPQLAAPTAVADPLSFSTLVSTGLSATKVVNTVMSTTSSAISGRGILIADARLEFGGISAEEEGILVSLPVAPAPALRNGATASPVSARMARAALLGKLSVPARWATAVPEIRPTPLTASGCPPMPAELTAGTPGASGSVFSQSILGTLSRDGPDRPRYKSKPIIVRSPAAG